MIINKRLAAAIITAATTLSACIGELTSNCYDKACSNHGTVSINSAPVQVGIPSKKPVDDSDIDKQGFVDLLTHHSSDQNNIGNRSVTLARSTRAPRSDIVAVHDALEEFRGEEFGEDVIREIVDNPSEHGHSQQHELSYIFQSRKFGSKPETYVRTRARALQGWFVAQKAANIQYANAELEAIATAAKSLVYVDFDDYLEPLPLNGCPSCEWWSNPAKPVAPLQIGHQVNSAKAVYKGKIAYRNAYFDGDIRHPYIRDLTVGVNFGTNSFASILIPKSGISFRGHYNKEGYMTGSIVKRQYGEDFSGTLTGYIGQTEMLGQFISTTTDKTREYTGGFRANRIAGSAPAIPKPSPYLGR